ncbi:Asp23/Gls24 family envelope stress response protein [Nocardia australiensis]|uniref:Asp23/Gls24 family envelope stress response protein n=1 Tax=Nocardia australiensis TaxID=2887191 RepID=UPI001D137C9D|nr:Asp23/Gls24 family envelope stress response protein [Nocardia australiensis]
MTETPASVTVIEAPVVAAVAAWAAAATTGVVRLEAGVRGLFTTMVRAGRQRWTDMDPAPSEGVRVRRTTSGVLNIDIDVVIAAGTHAAEVGRAVQQRVAGAVLEQTGQAVDAVSVVILDIEPERTS